LRQNANAPRRAYIFDGVKSGCERIKKSEAMAQKQLLLLTMAAFIVGVAMMTGSDQFKRDHDAAVKDQMRDLLYDIAARAQAWYQRPTEYGGKRSFLNFSLGEIHSDSYSILGEITLTNKQPDSFRIIGVPAGDSSWSLIVDVYPDSLVVAQ
jgi:hypothetical protein